MKAVWGGGLLLKAQGLSRAAKQLLVAGEMHSSRVKPGGHSCSEDVRPQGTGEPGVALGKEEDL